MINKLRKTADVLAPAFLKRLDRHLLLNNRLLWMSKIHYVTYYLALFGGLGTLLVTIMPFSLHGLLFNSETILFWTCFLSAPLLLIWIFSQTLFSIHRDFGNQFPMMAHSRFFLNFVIVAMFVILPNWIAGITQNRIANLVSKEQLRTDLENLNIGNPYFPTGIYNDNIFEANTVETASVYNFSYFNSYQYDYYDHSSTVDDKKGLFEKRDSKTERLRVIETYITTLKKYNDNISIDPQEALQNFEKEYVSESYGGIATAKEKVQSAIHSVSRAQSQQFWTDFDFYFVAIFFSFVVTGLLGIYQNVGLKESFIGALSFVASLFVFGFSSMALVETLFNSSERTSMIAIAWLLFFAFVVVKAISIKQMASFSRFKLICLMIADVCMPFVFVFLTMLFNANMSETNMQGSILVGMVFYGLIMLPFQEKLYRKIQSLPK